MDSSFQNYEAKRTARNAQQQVDDFNNEQAGRDVGRIERHGYGDVRALERKRREDDEKRRDLLFSAQYLAKYEAIMADLTDAEALIYDALIEASETLSEMRSIAACLPNGTKVFMDADGNIYDEHGNLVSKADADLITWPKDTPSWEEYKNVKDRRDQLDQDFDRLAVIRYRMEDDSNRPSEDELDGFKREVDAMRTYVEQSMNAEMSFEAEPVAADPDNEIELDFSGLSGPSR